MPEASEHALSFLSRTVGGVEFKFAKLTPRDRAGILRQLKSHRKVMLREHLKEAGLSPAQVFTELEMFEDRVYGQKEFIDYVNSADGPAEIAADAFRKKNGADLPAGTIEALEAERELFPLVAELCNLALAPITPPTQEGSLPPNPPPPAEAIPPA